MTTQTSNIQFSIPDEALKHIESVGTYTFTTHTGDNTYQVKLIRADKNEPINVRLRLLSHG